MGCVRNIVNFYYDGIIIQQCQKHSGYKSDYVSLKLPQRRTLPPQGFTLRRRVRLHVGCRVRPCFKSAKTAAFANTTNTTNTTSTNTTYSLVDTMLLNS